MMSGTKDLFRTLAANERLTLAIDVIAEIRRLHAEGVLTRKNAKRAEGVVCRYHVLNDNWCNEIADIMEDRSNIRPALW